MRVLIAHNTYKIAGGEDTVVAAETALLRARGHEVELLIRDNRDLDTMGAARAASSAIWSQTTSRMLRERVAAFKPDILHVHNSFPLMSPSIYWTGHALGLPVVKTLHNFRLLCIQGNLMRNGTACHRCVDGLPLHGALHRCYRQSAAQSLVATAVQVVHRVLPTYTSKVDQFIVMSEFARRMFAAKGLPGERLHVKPNFASFAPDEHASRSGLLYVGRLSEEKGIGVLAQAVEGLGAAPVKAVGTGPLEDMLRANPGIELAGWQDSAAVGAMMQRAAALVLASTCYEGCPMVVLEAFANGLPVIASRLGSLPEFVRDGETGLLFEPGDVADLRRKMAWALANPQAMREMGERARRIHAALYAPDRNFQMLESVYRQAMTARTRGRALTTPSA